MKKLLLSIVFALISSVTAFAADLNPFAYNLKSEYNEHAQTLTINFTLNAPASYVKLAISNGTNDVWTKEYFASSYQAGKVPKSTYTVEIDVLEANLPQGEPLTWRVDVKGAAVGSPTFVKNDVRLYAPTSVDIDNNPDNANFGTVFCVEGLNGAYQTSGYTNYISYTDGAGLYVLNADGTARKMPYQGSNVRYGYNGGVVNTDGRTRPFFGNNGTNDLKGYHAYRVRVSDDGRIFVTAFSIYGHVLWEAKKECFSATTQAEWSANTGWHKIMTDDDANTFMATKKRTCSHTYCGIYSLYEGNATSGKFIAGPNLGFDVRGAGDQLKLLMLAGCQQAIVYSTPAHFYCDEYDLGTATLWNTEPSRRVFSGHSDGVDIVNPQGVQVQYDKNGNVWMCQHRGLTTNTTLARINRSLSSTKVNNVEIGQVDHNESSHTYRRCGAIRFNEDFTQVAIASNANPKAGNSQGGGFTVYPVDQSTGMPVWNQGTQVNTNSYTGVSLMDFAWDYAGNLYIAADAATNGERIAVYAMPHAADRVVSTPAASKYGFTVTCQPGATYTVTTICDPEEGGTITCQLGGNTRAVGVLTDIPSCTQLTVTATPADGYKFRNWTDENSNVLSTNKEYSLYVTKNITLQANFEYATYTGIVWKNLFLNGEDIADKVSETYKNRNERLWRLFQVEYNAYFSDHIDAGEVNDKFKVYYFLNTAARTDSEETNSTIRTNTDNLVDNSSYSFHWLGQYVEGIVGKGDLGAYTNKDGTYHLWGYYLQAFFNRMGIYNADITSETNLNSLTGYPNTNFSETGKTEKWRPYWAEAVCKLPRTMKYSDYMPTVVTWNRPSVKSKETDYITPKGSSVKCYGSSWYKWNHPHTDGFPSDQKDVEYQKYFILAWRKGSPTAEEIVHHVYESNMELHASYVLTNIDEEDRVDVSQYDASNDDVFQLLLNRRWVNLDPDPTRIPTHNLTITRKLQAGMYNTICLPFDVDLTGLADNNDYKHPLKDADAYEFAGTTTSTYNESGEPVTVLNFNKVTQLRAGTPYLIQLKGNADVTDVLPFTTVACDTILRPSVGGGLIFQPTVNPTTVPAGSLILVANNRLALTTSDGTMLGMRGYFMIDPTNPLLADDIAAQAADGRVYLSMNKPTTTSIPVAPEAEQQVKPEVRKVMYEGKIYILRGDEVYDMMGRHVGDR